jgi:Ca-activated chloride channel family protein
MNTGWLSAAIVLVPLAMGPESSPRLAANAQAPAAPAQASRLTITSPESDTIVTGPSQLAAQIIAPDDVESVSFFVDGRLACTVEQPPYQCGWDAGSVVRGRHVRVVAQLTGGGRLVGNVRTKDLGYQERIRVDAVLVPVIVTERGKFVRGLKKQDFQLYEDGVAQPVGSLVSEEAPLELVLAIDISGSMEAALPVVKQAVKQLLGKLRPGDSVTLVGFNDTTFIVAERETNQQAREDAVELLASWGGTALYDATVTALDLVSKGWGRKGVVVFSDGDDRDSLTRRETAMSRVQASDAMLFTVGFGAGGAVPELRRKLETYAHSTGGRAFFPQNAAELDQTFDAIVTELANQYVLSYTSTNQARDKGWRNIKVQVPSGKYGIRARQGYRAVEAAGAGR